MKDNSFFVILIIIVYLSIIGLAIYITHTWYPLIFLLLISISAKSDDKEKDK